MKILQIDHIGVAVHKIDDSKKFWSEVLGFPFAGNETIEEQKENTAFFPFGIGEIELLESTDPDGPLAKFIEKKGEGVQHIAFRVFDIEEAIEELKSKGIKMIDDKPKKGAGGALSAFVHPRATNGVLVELCERNG